MVKVIRHYHPRSSENSDHRSSHTVIHVNIHSIDNKSIEHKKQISSNSIILKNDHLQTKSTRQSLKISTNSVRVTSNPHQHHSSLKKRKKTNKKQNSFKTNVIPLTNSKLSENASSTIDSNLQEIKSTPRSSKITSHNHDRDMKHMSIKQSNRWDLVEEYHSISNRNKQKRCCLFNQCCQCSRVSAIASVFCVVIFAIALASILIGTLFKPSKTTTISPSSVTLMNNNTTTAIPLVNITLIVPENTQVFINCSSPTPSINIVDAYYGILNCTVCNCLLMDFTNYTTSYCANNGSPSVCIFTAGNAFFGDTCPGMVKHFWLTYFCS